jgi:hypothetical protein
LHQFKWGVLKQLPKSSDLAPSDLFTHTKKWFGAQHLTNDQDLKNAVTGWLKCQASKFYAEGVSKLHKRYEKCFNLHGNHVKK